MEFLPNGNIQNQNDIYEYASDNNVFSSLRARIETKIGDGPVTSSPGAIFVKNNDGNFVLASPIGWTIADIGTGKNISQILVNEVIKGQLKPVRRMINIGFQNKNLNNPWLPHLVIDFTSVIAQDNDNFWVFERGTYECMTDIITGDWFVIKKRWVMPYTERSVVIKGLGWEDGTPFTAGSGGTSSTNITETISNVSVSGITFAAYAQEFLSTVSNVLTVTKNNNQLPITNQDAQIQVYQNGQLLIKSQYVVTLPNTITIDSNTHYNGSNYIVTFIILA